MIRKINLIHYKNKQIIKDFQEVAINDIDSIINYSVDILYCSCLNKIENNKISDYLDKISKKIRHGGQLVIVVIDVITICQSFLNRSISEIDFFRVIKECEFNLTESYIFDYFNKTNNFELIGIEKNQHMTALSFGRKSND